MAEVVKVCASAHSCPLESYRVLLGLGTNTKRDIVVVRITGDSGAVGFGCGIEIYETVLERYPAIPGPCYVPGWAGR